MQSKLVQGLAIRDLWLPCYYQRALMLHLHWHLEEILMSSQSLGKQAFCLISPFLSTCLSFLPLVLALLSPVLSELKLQQEVPVPAKGSPWGALWQGAVSGSALLSPHVSMLSTALSRSSTSLASPFLACSSTPVCCFPMPNNKRVKSQVYSFLRKISWLSEFPKFSILQAENSLPPCLLNLPSVSHFEDLAQILTPQPS